MRRKKGKNMMALVGLIVGVTGITVAFAALSSTLTISGTATMVTAVWDVKFANLAGPTLTGDASVVTPPTLTDTTVGTFDVVVTKPGDSIAYTFDVTNTGNLEAEIGTYTKDATPTCSGLSGADETLVCGNLTYTLKYTSGGADVAVADTLASAETKNMTLKLEYGGAGLPDDDVDITGLGIIMIYVEQ